MQPRKQQIIRSATDSSMCLVHAADGIKMVPCSESPEMYWMISNAVGQISSQNGMAGSNMSGETSIPKAVHDATVAPSGTLGNQMVPMKSQQKPTQQPPPPVDMKSTTMKPMGDNFSGSIGTDGVQLNISFLDIIVVLILLYILKQLF